MADVSADVGAGNQRAQAGHAPYSNPGAHHPEAGSLAGKAGGIAVERDVDKYMGVVFADLELRDVTDDYALVLDLGFPRGQAVGVVELNGDGRPGLHVVL